MKPEYRLQEHTLGEALQPLVGKVPKFKDEQHLQKWIQDHFPCRSLAVATVASLAKWVQNKKLSRVGLADRPIWFLSTGDRYCPLCEEVRLDCHYCSLGKTGEQCVHNPISAYHIARMDGDKQPLIEALEKASLDALVNELGEKCAATVKEAFK